MRAPPMPRTIRHTVTLVGIVCAITMTARAQNRPDIPFISARTDNWGKSTVRGTDSAGWQESQDMSALGVRVELKSFRSPQQPYDVQCFFIARKDVDKSEYIYNVQRRASSAQFDVVVFQAPPLKGHGQRTLFIPVIGPTSGVALLTQGAQGSRFYGWIIRVVSQGMVVRVDSNQPTLKFLAGSAASTFDAAVRRVNSN